VETPHRRSAIQGRHRSQQCYDFVRGLHADNRPAATVEIIAAAKPVSAKTWTKLRREQLATMTEQDRQAVVQSWGLDPDDKRVLLALAKEETYKYFSTMTKLQREWVSWNKFMTGKVPSDDDIENAKKQAATIAAQEQAKKEKEQRTEAAKKKREATAKGWADYQDDVRERVRKRFEAELPDFDWRKLVDAALGATGQKIKASLVAADGCRHDHRRRHPEPAVQPGRQEQVRPGPHHPGDRSGTGARSAGPTAPVLVEDR